VTMLEAVIGGRCGDRMLVQRFGSADLRKAKYRAVRSVARGKGTSKLPWRGSTIRNGPRGSVVPPDLVRV
jgi:hypothetical protein